MGMKKQNKTKLELVDLKRHVERKFLYLWSLSPIYKHKGRNFVDEKVENFR